MVDPINLRQFKKRKARADKEKKSEENRTKYGLSTKLRKTAKANQNLTQTKLDRFKLDKKE